MRRTVKYFRHPTFTALEWETRKPYLQKGEIGFLLDNGEVTGFKVGPGLWIDLPLQGNVTYPYDDIVTNPIGDAKGVLFGEQVVDIVHKMLNPYQGTAFSSVLNNAVGSYQASPIREIGAPINGPIGVNYTLSNSGNVIGDTPVTVSAGGIFSNEGSFPLGPILLNLKAPLNPAAVAQYNINLSVTHQKGNATGQTSIRFYPKIMWVVSSNPALDPASFMAIASKSTLITNQHKRDYNFGGGGYSYLLIPSMLNPSNLSFTDVINPNAPAGYSMENLGSQSVNNGVGTYSYLFLRSTFNLISPTILRVS